MVNANNIIPEFSQANMEAIVNAYPLGALHYQGIFPVEYNPTLNFASIEGTEGAKIMADVVAIGSKAPRKGRDFVETIKGEIPKVEIARDLTEKDLLTLDQLRHAVSLQPQNTGVKNQLISKIYEDIPFCIDGVNARLEWMAKQLASTGRFKTTASNNAGGVADLTIDFKVSSENAAKNWHADTDSNPIEEIQKIQDKVRSKGYAYSTITLGRDTLDKILNNVNTRAFVLGVPLNPNTILPNVSLEQLNNQLSSKGLPIIRLWESFISMESKAGIITNASGWEEGNILFSVTENLGTTQYTTTSEFRMDFADVISKAIKDNFILVKTFGHQDPIMISTKATAFALPVLNNSKRNLILKTKF